MQRKIGQRFRGARGATWLERSASLAAGAILTRVVFPKYAGMRDSDAEGSINFLLLKCPISRLAIRGSFQLKVLTSETSAAARVAKSLVPCISLSLGLLTSPPSASM